MPIVIGITFAANHLPTC